MPQRQLVSKELAEIFKIVAHPDRIRIIEELLGNIAASVLLFMD